MIDIIRSIVAVLAGIGIGYSFGLLQNVALRRHAAQQTEGKFKLGVSLLPGTGARIAYLLLSLVVVQLICPLLFSDGVQWLVSGGLLVGYGLVMFVQMRQRLKEL